MRLELSFIRFYLLLVWAITLSLFCQPVASFKQMKARDVLKHSKEQASESNDVSRKEHLHQPGATFAHSTQHNYHEDEEERPSSMHGRSSDDVVTAFFQQPIDHFRSSQKGVNATLMQRFFYSARYVLPNVTNLPTYALLCCGGEGPALDASVLVDSVHCSGDMLELARRLYEEKQAHVHLYAVEHRYYGESYPVFWNEEGDKVPSLATKNLKYLSSRQALADLNAFVTAQDKKLPPGTKWISFGGSYPGWLAAYVAEKYPTKIHAAVSSSSPVHLQVHFPGYKERQAWDLQYEKIGGSSECLQVVLEGHASLIEMFETGQYDELTEQFNLCDVNDLKSNPRNVQMWLGDGVIDVPAQSNDPSCEGEVCDLDKVCQYLLSENEQSGAVAALAGLSQLQNKDNCVSLDWDAFLSFLNSTDIDNNGDRSWVYQTCTEVGYYQTCDADSLCPFGRGYHNLDMDYEICDVLFGMDAETVNKNVATTRDHFGLLRGEKRILSVNGDVDPWSVLALTTSEKPLTLPTYWVRGASHHFWTHPVKDSDSQEVQEARQIIHEKIIEWLAESFPSEIE